jgi:hypothetical protein
MKHHFVIFTFFVFLFFLMVYLWPCKEGMPTSTVGWSNTKLKEQKLGAVSGFDAEELQKS